MFKSILPYFKRKISVADLVIMALLVALSYVLGLFDIYLMPSFKLFTLDFLPNAMGAALFGPFWGGVMGAVTDVVAYFAKPTDGFFPGWMISQIVANIIYALFLYKRPVKILNIALMEIIVIVTVNLGLDMLWLHMTYGKTAGSLYTVSRLIGHLVRFPFKVFLIFAFVKLAKTTYAKVFNQ